MTYYFSDLTVRRALSRLAEEVEIDHDKDIVFKYYTLNEDGEKEPTERVLVYKEIRHGNRKAHTCWQQNPCKCKWCRYDYASRRPFFSSVSFGGIAKPGKGYFRQKGMKKQFQKWMKFELQSLDNI